jgi:D-beta-D-heptose 7-phosphate kinase/D-beta-D-heptose 1-phosphate adenosyltransferase
LLDPLGSFAGIETLVVGDAMLDSYLLGSSERLYQEAPVPIVAVADRESAAGGAGNVAANIRALGGRVRLVSITGADSDARTLRRCLDDAGVDVSSVLADPRRETLTKERVVSAGHLLLRVDRGTTGAVSGPVERAIVESLRDAWGSIAVVIVSDYGYGTLTPAVLEVLVDLQRADRRPLVVDAKDLARYRDVGATAVKPNYAQATSLLGEPAVEDGRAEQVMRLGDRLLEATGADIVAVTLDADGALAFERGRPMYRTYARPTRAVRTGGAGDAFCAALGLALASGSPTPVAIELASAAAAVVVAKERTSVCSASELRQHVARGDEVVASADEATERVEFLRGQGLRIVFTNGCFDVLHRGHVTYLSRAKALGDVLVVGVNSDDWVRSLKGPDRPINPLEDRVEVLCALSCVDLVVPFDERTPERLIAALAPDVFVKGGDYTVEMLPEAALVERLGGTVDILPYVDDRSTTGILERIRADRGDEPAEVS